MFDVGFYFKIIFSLAVNWIDIFFFNIYKIQLYNKIYIYINKEYFSNIKK